MGPVIELPDLTITVFATDAAPRPRIDEIVLRSGAVSITRIGTARYAARFESSRAFAEIVLWTTERGRIVAAPRDDDRFDWVTFAIGDDGTLDSIHARDVDAHLEEMNRGSYFMSLARGESRWGVVLSSDGYIKSYLGQSGAR